MPVKLANVAESCLFCLVFLRWEFFALFIWKLVSHVQDEIDFITSNFNNYGTFKRLLFCFVFLLAQSSSKSEKYLAS